jgi:tetratricopeptide (TPR) repeat protein
MGGRVVDCARLESVYAARHPGFESPPIRRPGLFPLRRRLLSQNIAAMRAAGALFLFLLFTASATNSENAPVDHLLDAARSDYLAGHLDSALAALDQHDKAKGPNGDSLDLRGLVLFEEGKFEAAANAFIEAHKMAPELFAPRLHLGDLYLREKKYPEAREIYQKLAGETDVLISRERLRYGLLLIALAAHAEAPAKSVLDNIKFPTETPAYYFAQAAWEFAHGNEGSAEKWLATAGQIFDRPARAWFARPLYDLGWLKEKPSPPPS